MIYYIRLSNIITILFYSQKEINHVFIHLYYSLDLLLGQVALLGLQVEIVAYNTGSVSQHCHITMLKYQQRCATFMESCQSRQQVQYALFPMMSLVLRPFSKNDLINYKCFNSTQLIYFFLFLFFISFLLYTHGTVANLSIFSMEIFFNGRQEEGSYDK